MSGRRGPISFKVEIPKPTVSDVGRRLFLFLLLFSVLHFLFYDEVFFIFLFFKRGRPSTTRLGRATFFSFFPIFFSPTFVLKRKMFEKNKNETKFLAANAGADQFSTNQITILVIDLENLGSTILFFFAKQQITGDCSSCCANCCHRKRIRPNFFFGRKTSRSLTPAESKRTVSIGRPLRLAFETPPPAPLGVALL